MPKIVIVIPLSREWRVQAIREQLDALDTEGLEIHELVLVDNRNIRLDWKSEIHYLDLEAIGESNAWARRQRIADIMNTARRLCPPSDYVFILEDDTEIQPDFLKRLLTNMTPNTGLISGVQAGRWASSMLGIWKTNNPHNPTIWETLPLPESTAP